MRGWRNIWAVPMIKIDNGAYQTPKFSLSINLHLKANVFAAVLGTSGSGKSTLLSLLAGFERLNQGNMFLGGINMAGVDPAQRPVSMVFQDHNVFSHLTVQENVAIGISPSLKLSEPELVRVDAALSRVGLSAYAERKPNSISGGVRQRIALARVLVRDKKILLLDEPFAALDPGLRHDMLNLVSELKAERGLTVLLVTHQPEEAERAAEQIIFVSNGKVREPVACQDFFTLHDPEIDAYLGQSRFDG